MFSHNSGQHRSLTLPFEPFRFWLQIRGDIHNQNLTPWLSESGNRWLPVLVSRGVTESPYQWVANSLHQWVTNSLHQWVRESPTSRIGESGSRQLPVLVSGGVGNQIIKRKLPVLVNRGVGDSPTQWLGELLSEYFSKKSLTQGVGELPTLHVGESESRWLQRVGNSPNCSVAEWFFDFEYLHKFEAKVRTAKTVVYGNHIKPIYAKNLGKFGSLPCPFSL